MVHLNIIHYNLNIGSNFLYNFNLNINFDKFIEELFNNLVYVDLILFNSAFDLNIVSKLTKFFEQNNWYVSKMGNNSIINSGIIIASKWPIISRLEEYYTNCDIYDCLSSKGPLYIRIKHPLFTFNIIGNSFQDGTNFINDIRKLQINELNNWINKKVRKCVKKFELFIIIGNFNILYNENIFKYLEKKLNGKVIKFKNFETSNDYILNLNKSIQINSNVQIEKCILNDKNIIYTNLYFELPT